MISKLFEYLKNLKARNTFNVRTNLNSFNNLKLLFKMVIDGNIEIKSITAIGVIGYTKKEITDFFSL
mgnify:CR=1 FL=1